MQNRGAELMRQCLVGLSGASPPNQLRNLIETMRVLVEACPGAVQSWLLTIVQAPGFRLGAVDRGGERQRLSTTAMTFRPPPLKCQDGVAGPRQVKRADR